MSLPVVLGIEIWSDVMCPWCVIGYHNLRKGLALLEGDVAGEIVWRPFELNPDMPPEGEELEGHILRKYGRAPDPAMTRRMQELAANAGYEMAYRGSQPEPGRRLWNTRRAHVLLTHALLSRGIGTQTRLKLALFDSNFQYHRDIHDSDVLFDIAETCGIPRDEAAQALVSPDLAAAVVAEKCRAMELGVSGVPAMLVAGRYMIPGSQEPEVYAASLRKVAERLSDERDRGG